MTISHENLPLTLEVEPHFALATAPPASGPAAVLALMAQAVEKGMAVETMQSLQEMFHKEQDREAGREHSRAMAEFQRECPPIPKTKTAHVTGRSSGTGFDYTYAPLETIAQVVNPHLHQRGLSYSWDTVVENNRVNCTCILRHANGHEIRARYSEAIVDSTVPGAGSRIATTVAMRRSLIQVLGLTTAEPDNDHDESDGPTIGEGDIANLEALLNEVKADRAKFLAFMRVKDLNEIQTQAYPHGVRALENMRKRA